MDLLNTDAKTFSLRVNATSNLEIRGNSTEVEASFHAIAHFFAVDVLPG